MNLNTLNCNAHYKHNYENMKAKHTITNETFQTGTAACSAMKCGIKTSAEREDESAKMSAIPII